MYKRRIRALFLPVALIGTAACESLVEVDTPNLVDAETIDPLADQTTFARSAVQNFYTALGPFIVYSAWFTNEVRVGDTYPTRNEFGRRLVDDDNDQLNDELWLPLGRAVASAENTIDLLKGLPDADRNINLVRANFGAGFSLLMMAETFCQGVIRVGAPLTASQVLDTAIVRFQRAITVGTTNGTADAVAMANAARVGLARAYLAQGKKAEAAAAAALVPDGFVFNVPFVDDPSNRIRLNNHVFWWSAGGIRESIIVGPEWRTIADAGDPRITYFDAGRNAQDSERLYGQRKYTAWNSSIRLASKLEARYIEAEAGTTAQRLALIAERRAANGRSAFTGTSDAEVMAELMYQRGLEFWLEGKRMGDFQRHGNDVPFIIQPGDNYYKPALGQVGDQKCWPLTTNEKNNNPNF